MSIKTSKIQQNPLIVLLPVLHSGLCDPLHGQAVLREAEPEPVVRLEPGTHFN